MKHWKTILFAMLSLIGIAGLVFSVVMTVMAVQYLELGRVLFYGLLAIMSLELAVYSLYQFLKKRD